MNQNATQNVGTAEENAGRKKKKRKRRRRRRNGDQLKPTQAAPDLGRRYRPRAIDPGRTATQGARRTQVAWRTQVALWPRSRGEHKSRCDPGRRAIVSGFFFFFFFNLSSLMNTFFSGVFFSFFSDEHVGAALVVFFFVFLLNVNRVLETWFSYRCHVEKVSHRTRTTHKNRALEARFRAQNRAFEARVAKNPYSL